MLKPEQNIFTYVWSWYLQGSIMTAGTKTSHKKKKLKNAYRALKVIKPNNFLQITKEMSITFKNLRALINAEVWLK